MSMIKDPNYIFGASPEPVKTPDDHTALWLGIAAALGVGFFILMKDTKETVSAVTSDLAAPEITAEESISEALGEPLESVQKKKRKSSKLS